MKTVSACGKSAWYGTRPQGRCSILRQSSPRTRPSKRPIFYEDPERANRRGMENRRRNSRDFGCNAQGKLWLGRRALHVHCAVVDRDARGTSPMKTLIPLCPTASDWFPQDRRL
jgi:hypothetical protein